jgi:hypothetical protein
MNLVQINEHLKDVPLQALMKYANGQDPMVPAYMATGEMKRREIMQQKQSQAQQASQGQSPTVKDQVEQQAGLMALQAQQQKQAQQQMMQQAQAQPMPAPPETPQPVPQGQEEPEFAMGGIARLPVNYDFASGGIIAFAGEGRSDVPVVEETEEEKMRRIQRMLTQGLPSMQGIKPPAETPLPQQSVQPTAEQGGKLPSLEELMTGPATLKAAQQALNPQTLEQINEDRVKARELAGVKGEYGADQRKRLAEEEAQYQAMLKDRQFNNLIAVLSGMGRGGLGGAGPAYLQNQAAQQSADIAQKRRMTEQYGTIDKGARDEALAAATVLGSEASKQRNLAGEAGTGYAKEAMNNANALARIDIEYKNRLREAELKFASDQELQKINNDYALARDKINKEAAIALERFRQSAPTDEQRNFEVYLGRWKKDPANKNKQETEAFTQYFADRLGGQFKENKTDVTGLNQLLESYQKQLDDITLPESEKTRIRALVVKTQNDLRDAIGRGRQGGLPSLTGGNVDTNNPLLK